MELDVYIPSIRVGIEFDGANWHNSEAQFEREKKKYAICKEQNIKLIRVKENTELRWKAVADLTYYIPKVRTYTKLEETIDAILDSIDPNSNVWTRKNPLCFYSTVRADLEQDRADILSYLSEINEFFGRCSSRCHKVLGLFQKRKFIP